MRSSGSPGGTYQEQTNLQDFLDRVARGEMILQEIDDVAGGMTRAGAIAMTLASGWAGMVAGFAAGTICPGIGNVLGAAVGGGVGVVTSLAMILADTP